MADVRGIPCGYNPVNLGGTVDANKQVLVEVGNLFCGNMVTGNLIKLETFFECATPSLGELYNKHKSKLGTEDCLYLVSTSALTGTIYVCGHVKREEWTVFAKTAGYA